MRFRLTVATSLSAAMLLAACSPAPAGAPPPAATAAQPAPAATAAQPPLAAKPAAAPSGAPIKVGVVFSQTGPLGAVGSLARVGAQVAADDINAAGGIKGRPVQATFCDDASDEARVVTCMKQMVSDKVVGVVGPLSSPPALAAAPISDEARLPMFALATASSLTTPVRPYLFKVSAETTDEFTYLAEWLQQDKKLQRVALLADSGAFGQDAARVLSAELPKRGIQIVASETYQATDTDVTAQLTRIKSTDAQALVTPAIVQTGALIAKNKSALGLTLPQLAGSGVESDAFIKLAGSAGEGIQLVGNKVVVYDSLPKTDPSYVAIDAYFKAAVAAKGEKTDLTGGLAWDGMHLLALGIAAATNPDDSASVKDGVEVAVKGYRGATSSFTYSSTSHGGNDLSGFILTTLKNGKWVPLGT